MQVEIEKDFNHYQVSSVSGTGARPEFSVEYQKVCEDAGYREGLLDLGRREGSG